MHDGLTCDDGLVYDIGMHKGEDSEYYLKKGFRVVGVEANPLLVEFVARRLAPYVKSGKLTIVASAIAPTEDPIEFYSFETASIWGTTVKAQAERQSRLGPKVSTITVPGTTFARLLETYGTPYYLKIDIEGADTLCLHSLLGVVGRPKFISIESSKYSFEELFTEFCLFARLGYGKFKIVAQHRTITQRVPNPPLEGKYVDHRFEFGSSGLFGMELPGEWLTLEAAIRQYLKIFRSYRLFGDTGAFRELGVVRRAIDKSKAADPQSFLAGFVKDIGRPLMYRVGLKAGWYDTHAMHTGRIENA